MCCFMLQTLPPLLVPHCSHERAAHEFSWSHILVFGRVDCARLVGRTSPHVHRSTKCTKFAQLAQNAQNVHKMYTKCAQCAHNAQNHKQTWPPKFTCASILLELVLCMHRYTVITSWFVSSKTCFSNAHFSQTLRHFSDSGTAVPSQIWESHKYLNMWFESSKTSVANMCYFNTVQEFNNPRWFKCELVHKDQQI